MLDAKSNFYSLEENIIYLYKNIHFPFIFLKEVTSFGNKLRSNKCLQTDILSKICMKNNIPYHIFEVSECGSDDIHYKNIISFFEWKSKNINTISLSRITKEEFYFGEFSKNLENNFDYHPFSKLTYSEIKLINHFILTGESLCSIECDLLETLYNLDLKFNLLLTDPTKNKIWGTLSIEMKNFASNYFNLRRSRQHKIK